MSSNVPDHGEDQVACALGNRVDIGQQWVVLRRVVLLKHIGRRWPWSHSRPQLPAPRIYWVSHKCGAGLCMSVRTQRTEPRLDRIPHRPQPTSVRAWRRSTVGRPRQGKGILRQRSQGFGGHVRWSRPPATNRRQGGVHRRIPVHIGMNLVPRPSSEIPPGCTRRRPLPNGCIRQIAAIDGRSAERL